MDSLAAKIAERASKITLGENDFGGCPMAEHIPRFHRHETDANMSQSIQKHLESCEECNTLLMALAVQGQSRETARSFAWIKRGVRQVLDGIINLGELMANGGAPILLKGGLPALAMRGSQDDYSLAGKKIPLPDGSELYINVVVQAQKQILIASTVKKRRYDLYTRGGKILKSVDNAEQVRIDMSDKDIVLIIDDRFEIDIGGASLIYQP